MLQQVVLEGTEGGPPTGVICYERGLFSLDGYALSLSTAKQQTLLAENIITWASCSLAYIGAENWGYLLICLVK